MQNAEGGRIAPERRRQEAQRGEVGTKAWQLNAINKENEVKEESKIQK